MLAERTATIFGLSLEDGQARLAELADIMHACVHDGASVGYVLPFSLDDAAAFWRDRILPSVGQGRSHLLVAEREGRLVGTVVLDHDTPPNQPHRAEVRKLLVHPGFRRLGIARALMMALEGQARRLGRSLLTLDTRTGDGAEPLYRSLGFATVGVIPGFCVDALDTARLDSTTIMYKAL